MKPLKTFFYIILFSVGMMLIDSCSASVRLSAENKKHEKEKAQN